MSTIDIKDVCLSAPRCWQHIFVERINSVCSTSGRLQIIKHTNLSLVGRWRVDARYDQTRQAWWDIRGRCLQVRCYRHRPQCYLDECGRRYVFCRAKRTDRRYVYIHGVSQSARYGVSLSSPPEAGYIGIGFARVVKTRASKLRIMLTEFRPMRVGSMGMLSPGRYRHALRL